VLRSKIPKAHGPWQRLDLEPLPYPLTWLSHSGAEEVDIAAGMWDIVGVVRMKWSDQSMQVEPGANPRQVPPMTEFGERLLEVVAVAEGFGPISAWLGIHTEPLNRQMHPYAAAKPDLERAEPGGYLGLVKELGRVMKEEAPFGTLNEGEPEG